MPASIWSRSSNRPRMDWLFRRTKGDCHGWGLSYGGWDGRCHDWCLFGLVVSGGHGGDLGFY
jgi:hypothetical protein